MKQELKQMLRELARKLHLMWLKGVVLYFPFLIDYVNFKKSIKNNNRFKLAWGDRRPCLNEKTSGTSFDRHYIYHTAWAARILSELRPAFHTDISSSLYFSSIVSAFVPVKFFDYRPPKLNLSNLSCERADLFSLPFEDESIKSLSCMHTVEHVGLGRYGDKIDPEGDLKAIRELKRVLAKDGSLLFVVPIGKPMITFNAHRIYSYDQVLLYFSDLKLKEFSLIPNKEEKGGLICNATKEMADQEDYGCGCFWFVKKQ